MRRTAHSAACRCNFARIRPLPKERCCFRLYLVFGRGRAAADADPLSVYVVEILAVTVAGCWPGGMATTAPFGTCAATPASVGAMVIVPPVGRLIVVCVLAVVFTPAPTGVGAAGNVMVVLGGRSTGADSTRMML